jgi:hypothetical protein
MMKKEKQIDEELPTMRMKKSGWIHMSYFHVCREYRTSDFVLSKQPLDVASTMAALGEVMDNRQLMDFVRMFRFDEHSRSEPADCEGMTQKHLKSFYNFCAAYTMTAMMNAPVSPYIIADYVNKQRDLLIDEDEDDEVDIGRFTMFDDTEGHYYQGQLSALFPNEGGEEE